MANVSSDYFQPIFFLSVYPQFAATYGVTNAFGVLGAGLLSAIIGGIMSDKFGQKSRKNLSKICYISALLALPFMTASTLITSNFYLALGCSIMRVLIGETFWGPSVSMIQDSVPQAELSSYISAWQFFNYCSGGFITIFVSALVGLLGLRTNPIALGKLLAGISIVTYVGSGLAWWKAGKEYERMGRGREG